LSESKWLDGRYDLRSNLAIRCAASYLPQLGAMATKPCQTLSYRFAHLPMGNLLQWLTWYALEHESTAQRPQLSNVSTAIAVSHLVHNLFFLRDGQSGRLEGQLYPSILCFTSLLNR
jgi:hypothetical protein